MNRLLVFFKDRARADVVLPSILVAVATTVVKFAAALKEIAVAHRFGVGDDLDAYLIAYLYVTFTNLIVSVSFTPAIVPTYVDVKTRQGHHAEADLFQTITTGGILFGVVSMLVLFLLKPLVIPLLGGGFDAIKTERTMRLVDILLPVVALWGVATIWGAILNAKQKFVAVALTPVVVSICLIGSILLGASRFGIYSMAVGTLLGHCLELIVVWVCISKAGLPMGFRFDTRSAPARKIFRQCLPLCASTLMTTGMTLVDQGMAGMLKSGSVSALNYGYRLVGIMISLSASLWVVALPHFSRLAYTGDLANLRQSLSRYCRFAFVGSFPLAIALILFSTPIVNLFFERGAFMAEDTMLVSTIQRYYLCQLPFFVTGILMMRFLSSIDMNSLLMWAGVLGFLLNIGFNIILIRVMGVAGIALSTSIVSLVTFLFLLLSLRLVVPKLNKR